MKIPTYTMTHDSIAIVIGPTTYTIKRGDENFEAVRAAIIREDWAAVPPLVSKGLGLFAWLKKFPDFRFADNVIYYRDERLPEGLNARIIDMEKKGQSPAFLMKFWERLQNNPSWRSVQQTYNFLAHSDISIDQDGFILAYKGIKDDWYDAHTGRTHLNKPGAVIREPRNKISDDPSQGCHFGLHAGALAYAQGFSSRVVLVRIDPRDVVCIPNDHSCQKLRCCEYKVVGLWNGKKPLEMTTDTTEDEVLNEVTQGTEVTEIAKPATEDTETPEVVENTEKPWLSYNSMSDEFVKSQNVENLRRYASQVLKIVGASKLSRVDLVAIIIKTRVGLRK